MMITWLEGPKEVCIYIIFRTGQTETCLYALDFEELWCCSPHFALVVHRPGVIAGVAAERRVTSEAEGMKSGGKKRIGWD